MIGLIDCNNFFVSCERIFNPRLRTIPVVVLSNNDGCICALSNEAKNLGMKRGDPYFRVKDICDRHGAAVISGNHRLYGDISSRVMATIASVAGNIEVYSIDECFINFKIWPDAEVTDVGREIVRRVRRNVGIPTSLGIAPTRTLAKIASRFAKKYPAYRSVCAIDNEYRRRRALGLTPAGDIWGIGRRLVKRLANYGIHTAIQLADRSREDINSMLNIPGVRTWQELNGIPCIDIDVIEGSEPVQQKQMCCTRSFGHNLTRFEELSDAVALFSTIISKRLREHNLAAAGLTVFVHTNTHRPDLPQYCNSTYQPLNEPSNDTMTIAGAAHEALRAVFRKGYGYKRAGIIISELSDATCLQQTLFSDAADRERRRKLMKVIDSINSSSLSHDHVHIASYMPLESCAKSEHRSPCFSTRLDDIIQVKITKDGL